jgi:large subunit ribosomal protein L5
MAEKKQTKSKAKPKAKPKAKADKKANGYVPVFKKRYFDEVVPSMTERFSYGNVMEVPRITKISINMGIGDAKTNSKALESAEAELAMISGQKAVVTKSKKDISNFKIRRGFPVGCRVTIRGTRMYEFFERLVSIALPRTRDFRGLSFKSFDGQGNYSFGVKEQIIFTEIDYDKIDSIRGMDISITTSAETDDEAYWLLKDFGFPLREKPVKQTAEAPVEGEA